MSSFGTVILLKIFPALLPPLNEEDRDFYEVLGIPQGASESDVRKAYKTKSLALHPDKVAQRRESAITAEEAAKEYQLVQEAHTCLSDKSSRQKYHAVNLSPTRYRFLTSGGGLSNHMALAKNLSQASFADKTRLVLFVSIFPALVLVQPILIAVKVNHVLKQDGGALEDAPWMALLIPWWLLHGLFTLFWLGVSFIAPPEAKLPILSTTVEQLLWLAAFVLMALRWDNTITADYVLVFIPVYLALIMKWLHTVLTMQTISKDMSKMVSKDHFLNNILQGREPEELEEEELKKMHEQYVVVSQIPADIEHELENDEEFKNMSDEEKEEIRVSSSREFEAALEAYGEARRSMIKSMLLDVAFLVLLILKVDNHVSMSWWLVFLPILLSYGLKILHSCFTCCCLASPMDPGEAVVMSMTAEDLEKVMKEKENAGDNPSTDNKDQDENQEGAFALDSGVILHSLNTVEYNDKTGIVKGPIKDGRQEVYVQQLDITVALKLENLKSKVESEANGNCSDEKGPHDGETEQAQTNPTPVQKEEDVTKEPETDKPENSDPTTVEKENDAAGASAPEVKDALSAGASPSIPAEEANRGERTTNQSTGNGENSAVPDNAVDNGDGAKEGDDDDDNISIHIDQETYRAYQSAYAAAEQNVMEDRVKAGQDSCLAIIKITMVCLLVAKLEQAYEAVETREEEGDDVPVDIGFNTLWLIFPLFLVVGFMIFCCACLIYSMPDPEELINPNQEGVEGDEEANAAGDCQGETDTPIVFAPPPPPTVPDEAAVDAPAEESKANEDAKADVQEEAAVSPPEEDEGDINDLD